MITYFIKMNKQILILIILIFQCVVADAQQGYLSFSAARGLNTGGIIHPMFEQSVIDDYTVTVAAKQLKLGNSWNYRGDFRYFTDDYFGFGIQATLMRGSWQTFHSERKIIFIQRTTRSVRARGFSVAGALHGRIGDNAVMPYISVLPGYFFGTLDLIDTVTYSDQIKTSVWEYESLNSFFCNVAAGLDFAVKRELVLFVDFELQTLTVSPQRAYLKFLDGSNKLEKINPSEKVIVFVDQITSDYTQVPDENQPKREIRPYFPLNNFQIRVGFRFAFGRY